MIEIDMLLNKVNGVLFPGGDANKWEDKDAKTGFSQLTKTVQHIVFKVS